MRKTLRISAIVLLGLVAALGIGCLGLKAYLNTGSAHRLISSSLTDRFGGDIVVTDVSSGMGSTSVEIELPGSTPDPSGAPATPIVKGTVHLDASPVALAAGSTPDSVTVENAQITLHFDKDGNITDKLPQPKSGGGGGGKLPTIQVNGAAVHFVQEGKPDFRASGLDVTISDGGAKIAISGKAQDAHWGGWTLTGEWNADGSAGLLDFKSNGSIPFTPEKLRSIPFVPLEVWDVVQLEGTSPVHVRVGQKADAEWWWQVTAQPTASKLNIAAIDLGFTDVTGKVFVDGTKVTLTDVNGKTADGSVKMDAKLDFPPKKSDLNFDVVAKGLDIKKLPKSWNLPPQFTAGKALGSAKVRVVIEGEKTTTTGGGKIELEKAEVLGFPAEKAEFEMYSDGKKLRFGSPPPQLPAQKIQRTLPNPAEAQVVGLVMFLLQQPGTVVQPKPADATYVQANLKLKDVDLAEFLEKAKIAVPVKIAGKITLAVAAEIPINDAGKLKAYRVKGTATIPELRIEGLTLKNLSAELELRNGLVRLTKLAADVPDSEASGKPGSFLGTALVNVDPVGDLSADLKLTDLPLGPLVAAVPGLADVATGSVSGSFSISSPGEKISDLNNLKGSGKLTSETLSLYKNKIDNLTIELSVDKGLVQISKAAAELFRGSLDAKGKFSLSGQEAGAINLTFKEIDAIAATKGIPNLPVKIEGRVSGKLDAILPPKKEGEPQTANGALNLEAPQLKVQGIPAQRLKGAIGYKPEAVTFELKGEFAGGGSFDVDGTYPLGNAKAPANPPPVGPTKTSQVKITNFRLETLADALGTPALASLRGVLSAVVFFDFGEDGPTGKGWIDLAGFGWGSADLSTLTAVVRITPQKIELSEIGGTLANGSVRGRLVYGLDDARQRNYALHLQSINVETLLAPFGVENVEGVAEIAIRGSLGREIRGTGTVLCSRAIVDGIRVENLRSNLDWAIAPEGSGQFAVRTVTARVAGGRVRGDGLVRWGGTTHVEGKVDFTEVHLRGLLAELGQSTSTIAGRTTGKFQFGGSRIRSVNDIQGTLNATLGDAQVSALPVFRALTPYVAPLRATQPFKEGILQARLGGGKFRFERVTLAGPSVMMHIEGDVFLNGRLDLDIVANTGSLAPTPGTLRFLGIRLPAIGPIPVALVLEILNYLSNRVVRLTIGGTFDRPSVQVNTLALLSDEAIRFFMNRYLSVNGQPLAPPR